jgi:hypothetical protein
MSRPPSPTQWRWSTWTRASSSTIRRDAPGRELEHGCRTAARAPARGATIEVAGQAGCRGRPAPALGDGFVHHGWPAREPTALLTAWSSAQKRTTSLSDMRSDHWLSSPRRSQVQDLQKASAIMRLLSPAILRVWNPEISSRGHRDALHCEEDSNGNLAAGGICCESPLACEG